jgi:hypothetical protein
MKTCILRPAKQTACNRQRATCKPDDMQQGTYNMKKGRCNRNLPCATDRMQRAACNTQHTHAASTKKQCGKQTRCNRQSCSMQHAKNRLQHCSMRLRPSVAGHRRHATFSMQHSERQHAEKRECNMHQKTTAPDSTQQQHETESVQNKQPAPDSMQHVQPATDSMQHAKKMTSN